jgi:hypothetical protein
MVVKFTVPQRQGTLYAAVHLLMHNFSVKSVECTYALSLDSFAFLLGLTSRRPERLTMLRLQGTRCEFDAQLTECLAETLRSAHNLTRVTLARVWGPSASSRQIIQGLQGCTALTCALA